MVNTKRKRNNPLKSIKKKRKLTKGDAGLVNSFVPIKDVDAISQEDAGLVNSLVPIKDVDAISFRNSEESESQSRHDVLTNMLFGSEESESQESDSWDDLITMDELINNIILFEMRKVVAGLDSSFVPTKNYADTNSFHNAEETESQEGDLGLDDLITMNLELKNISNTQEYVDDTLIRTVSKNYSISFNSSKESDTREGDVDLDDLIVSKNYADTISLHNSEESESH
jgi:hypothetical protein